MEANRLSEAILNSNMNKCVDISSESNPNDYLNSNYTQTNESNLITNILNKNPNLINENNFPINSSKLYESLCSKRSITSSVSNEPKVVDIDSSDNSIEFNNEFMSESLLFPTIPSNSPQNSTQLMSNEILNNKTEVVNTSLPLIIIPPNNQTIGSSFSGQSLFQ